MSRRLVHVTTLTLLAFGALLTGCSDDATNPLGSDGGDVSGSATLETLDLDAEYGNLAFEDEADAFADDVLLSQALAADADALVDDEEDSVRGEFPALDAPQMQHTFLRVVWGQLDGRFDPAAEFATDSRLDWSGSITVSEGAVVLKRTLLFERPYDHRLPRDSRDSLAWVSHTGPHFDGVLVKIISPTVDGVAQGSVTFSTPLYETTLNVSELDDFELVVDVDALGNAISFQGQVFERERCATGFANGFWKNHADLPETDAVEMGGFRGRILNQSGLVIGYVMGRYGLNSEGERVLAGKYIGRGGRIIGLLGGTWEPDATSDRNMGTFQARWVNRRGNVNGTLQGAYRANDETRIGDGFFEARWQESCTSAL